jgi:probable H4MPT-linked C1 transfer pathway protein
MKVLAFDIGGANTKRLAADFEMGELESDIIYFPFWHRKREFDAFLLGFVEDADSVGITMTAELADVFQSKEEGVQYIIDACERVFENPFYLTLQRELIKKDEIKNSRDLAATNFLASTYYLEREFEEGLLVDCGSTTTDIIPFGRGEDYQKTDFERLKSGTLIYQGVLRTPVNAITDSVRLEGEIVPVASEYFAIAADVYNILRLIDADQYSCDTPDGRGRSRGESMQRISRLLCADLTELGEDAVIEICEYARDSQVEKLARIIEKHEKETAYVCGVGNFLAFEACDRAGIDAVDLSKVTKAHDNLPCLGLAHMLAHGQ